MASQAPRLNFLKAGFTNSLYRLVALYLYIPYVLWNVPRLSFLLLSQCYFYYYRRYSDLVGLIPEDLRHSIFGEVTDSESTIHIMICILVPFFADTRHGILKACLSTIDILRGFCPRIFPRSDFALLWLQGRTTWIVRYGGTIWRSNFLAFERACLFIIHVVIHRAVRIVDFRATRATIRSLWWVCHKFSMWFSSTTAYYVMDHVSFHVALLFAAYLLQDIARYLYFVIISWASYRLLLENLIIFTNPNPPEYTYTALENPDHIRVLLLWPRFAFQQICCSLSQGRYIQFLCYEAITYNWDSLECTEEILVNGCRKKVTKSAYEVLSSCSSLFFPQLLWIDALCIDQGNKPEKSEQVPMMRTIYSNAMITTVFLGRSPLPEKEDLRSVSLLPYRYDGVRPIKRKIRSYFEDTRLAFDLLNEFWILKSVLEQSDLSIFKAYESLHFAKSKKRQWEALVKMMQHPVFERVWVIQEVALSQKVRVRYGDEVIDWQILASGIEMLEKAKQFHVWLESTHGIRIRQTEHTRLYNITRMQFFRQICTPVMRMYHQRDGGWDIGFPELLNESFYFKATDPRDLIFGMMSICRDPIAVSYESEVEDVFITAAKALIERNAFDLLVHAAGVGNRTEHNSTVRNLPSWVPDFTSTLNNRSLKASRRRWIQEASEADIDVKATFKLKDPNILVLKGYCIDEVSELGPIMLKTKERAGQSIEEVASQLAMDCDSCWEFIDNSVSTVDPYPHTLNKQSLHDAFGETVFGFAPENFFRFEWMLADYSRGFYRDLLTEYGIYKTPQVIAGYADLIRSWCGERRFFISRKGYIGLCPLHTRRGDFIHVVRGILFPIMLRRENASANGLGSGLGKVRGKGKEKGGGKGRGKGKGHGAGRGPTSKYKLVGECYAHGLGGPRSSSGWACRTGRNNMKIRGYANAQLLTITRSEVKILTLCTLSPYSLGGWKYICAEFNILFNYSVMTRFIRLA